MPEEYEKSTGFDDVMRDLEDNIFGLEEDVEETSKEEAIPEAKKERKKTFPLLVDEKTAGDILKDFLKEKNQRRYDIMGLEIIFKPYWFFTYTAELTMRDEKGNIVESEEIGSRIAMDAVNGSLADHLQDLLDHEPIEIVDLADELGQVGDAKVINPKISEKRLEGFVQQKITGVLRADKENVSVAGFELLWAPVYKFWITIKKRTHNAQIDGSGGYPVNYDDIPVKPKTWTDRIRDDLELLADPKKWGKYLEQKRKSMASGGVKKPSNNTIELLVGMVGLVLFLYGMSSRDLSFIVFGVVIVAAIAWHMNAARKKPIVPLPPPPYMDDQGPAY